MNKSIYLCVWFFLISYPIHGMDHSTIINISENQEQEEDEVLNKILKKNPSLRGSIRKKQKKEIPSLNLNSKPTDLGSLLSQREQSLIMSARKRYNLSDSQVAALKKMVEESQFTSEGLLEIMKQNVNVIGTDSKDELKYLEKILNELPEADREELMEKLQTKAFVKLILRESNTNPSNKQKNEEDDGNISLKNFYVGRVLLTMIDDKEKQKKAQKIYTFVAAGVGFAFNVFQFFGWFVPLVTNSTKF